MGGPGSGRKKGSGSGRKKGSGSIMIKNTLAMRANATKKQATKMDAIEKQKKEAFRARRLKRGLKVTK